MACGNRPMTITSGNRCPEYNKSIGGHPNSAHIPRPKGKGVDTKVKGVKSLDVGLAAEKIGGMRIGLGLTFCHLDVMPPSPSRFWIYMGKKIIYSVNIENKDLRKFYEIITGKDS